MAPCTELQPYPEKPAPLRVWKPLLESNTASAADCAARHKELSEWAIKVTE